MKEYKYIFTIAAAVLLTGIFPIQAGAAAAGSKPTYSTVTEVFDWGPAVTKIIVNLGKTVSKGSVGTDTFKVSLVRTELRPDVKMTQDLQGERVVTKAYVSDQNGSPADRENFITLEMKFGPDVGLGYPIYYDSVTHKSNGWVKCDYTVTQLKDIASDSGKISGLTVNKRSGDVKKLVDDFKTGSYSYDGGAEVLTYASYAPANDGKKHPLIIWLHGTGEVGKDPTIPIAANKSCYFASPETQSYFGGAYVLSPQCSTTWMAGQKEDALMALIKDYVSKNSSIDTNRIYVGGNSNGGFMTMLLAQDYADYFAAAVPACEAMSDQMIPDSGIQELKKLPIWFTTAKTDTTVSSAYCTVATYDRLIKAGAKDAHLSYFDKVEDTTGLYKNADGTPYEYNGHFSFYYVFNNQCTDTVNGKKITILQWLAAQDKSKANTSFVNENTTSKESTPPKNESTPLKKVNANPKTENAARPVSPVLPIAILAAVIACGCLFIRRKQKKRNP